jgi:hypothetical protein
LSDRAGSYTNRHNLGLVRSDLVTGIYILKENHFKNVGGRDKPTAIPLRICR